MQVQLDQSGKIGDTKVPTVLAFSNDESYSILIPAVVKRECVQFLRQRFRRPRQPYMKLFAAVLFLLLKRHLSKIDTVVIDTEYIGHEGDVKEMLLEHIRRVMPIFSEDKITFRRVGKQSHAHYKAYETYTGRMRADRTIGSDELLSLLGK